MVAGFGVKAVSNVVRFTQTAVDDLADRMRSFGKKTERADPSDVIAGSALIAEFQELAEEVILKIREINRQFDAADRALDTIQNADVRTSCERQLTRNRNDVVAAVRSLYLRTR